MLNSAKKYYLLIALALTVGDSKSQETEGSKAYVPSRLEWLAMEMNVSSSYSDSDFYMGFAGNEKTNEIVIFVRYGASHDRELLNKRVNNARELVEVKAGEKGWLKWLKIKEDVKMDKR